MRPVPLWGRCIGSTDFTSRKKKMRKGIVATKQSSTMKSAKAMEVVFKRFCQF